MNNFCLMKIKNFCVLDQKGDIRYKEKNIRNTLHKQGQEFILKSVFANPSIIPLQQSTPTYYVGLDNRSTISTTDTIKNLDTEPRKNNYKRQIVGNWQLSQGSNIWIANSGAVVFSALGGTGWGPVRNIFLTTSVETCLTNTPECTELSLSSRNIFLISTARLENQITLASGEKIVLEMNLSIFN